MSVRDGVARASAFEGLKQSLIEKYGPPSDQDAKTERDQNGARLAIRTAPWQMPSTTVLLNWTEDENDIGNLMWSPIARCDQICTIAGVNIASENERVGIAIPAPLTCFFCGEEEGLEPLRDCSRQHLKLVRLPIPPPPQVENLYSAKKLYFFC